MSKYTMMQSLLSSGRKTRKASKHASIESDIVKGDGAFIPDYKIINSP